MARLRDFSVNSQRGGEGSWSQTWSGEWGGEKNLPFERKRLKRSLIPVRLHRQQSGTLGLN